MRQKYKKQDPDDIEQREYLLCLFNVIASLAAPYNEAFVTCEGVELMLIMLK